MAGVAGGNIVGALVSDKPSDVTNEIDSQVSQTQQPAQAAPAATPNQFENPDAEFQENTSSIEPKHRVKIDGQEYELTTDELVRYAQLGGDYTRKTQTLAQERQQLAWERQQYLQMLQGLNQKQEPQQQVDEYVAPEDDPNAPYDPEFLKVHKQLFESQREVRQVRQMIEDFQREQIISKAESHIESLHQQKFGRAMNPQEEQAMGQAITVGVQNGLAVSNPQVLTFLYNAVFNQQAQAAAETKVAAQVASDARSGVLSRGIASPTASPASAGGVASILKDLPGATNSERRDNANERMKKKYGLF